MTVSEMIEILKKMDQDQDQDKEVQVLFILNF
jgi:hypothetical protein